MNKFFAALDSYLLFRFGIEPQQLTPVGETRVEEAKQEMWDEIINQCETFADIDYESWGSWQ